MGLLLLLLLSGIFCAGAGGELFVRGTVGLARWLRIPAGIVGVTVAAFATSSPELTVGVSSALAGTPQLSLGDALGSNVVNIGLVLGAALLLGDLRTPPRAVQRDQVTALLAPVLLGILAVDGTLSRLDGAILLALFAVWLIVVAREAARQRVVDEPPGRGGPAMAFSLLGLALLIAAGRLIIAGAEGLAALWGVNAYIIGAVLVSLGTSIPELATTLIARLRGHDDIGLGTVLGSNLFNGLCIIGVVALLHPIPVRLPEIAVSLPVGMLVVAMVFPTRQGHIARWRGIALLLLYVGFLVVTWHQ